MADEKTITEKPKSLWNGALKMVKGDNSTQLIEQFTAEMTLVAEGLCEDQSKLRREVDGLMSQEDSRIQKLDSRIDTLERELDQEKSDRGENLKELRTRLAALEKKTEKPAVKEKGKGAMIKYLIALVAIPSAAWVIVTILQTIRP